MSAPRATPVTRNRSRSEAGSRNKLSQASLSARCGPQHRPSEPEPARGHTRLSSAPHAPWVRERTAQQPGRLEGPYASHSGPRVHAVSTARHHHRSWKPLPALINGLRSRLTPALRPTHGRSANTWPKATQAPGTWRRPYRAECSSCLATTHVHRSRSNRRPWNSNSGRGRSRRSTAYGQERCGKIAFLRASLKPGSHAALASRRRLLRRNGLFRNLRKLKN